MASSRSGGAHWSKIEIFVYSSPKVEGGILQNFFYGRKTLVWGI